VRNTEAEEVENRTAALYFTEVPQNRKSREELALWEQMSSKAEAAAK